MNIKDKIVISEHKCPAHYLPHKLPFGEPINDESCHIHAHPLRMLHHRPFCKLLRCPHYDLMVDASKEHRKKKRAISP